MIINMSGDEDQVRAERARSLLMEPKMGSVSPEELRKMRDRSQSSPPDTTTEVSNATSLLETMREMQGSAAGKQQILDVLQTFDEDVSPEMFAAIQRGAAAGHHVDGLEVAEGLVTEAEQEGLVTDEENPDSLKPPPRKRRKHIGPLRDSDGKLLRDLTMQEVEAEQLAQFGANMEWGDMETDLLLQQTGSDPLAELEKLRKQMDRIEKPSETQSQEEKFTEMKQAEAEARESTDDTPPEIKKFYEYLSQYYDLHGRLPPSMQRFSGGTGDMNDHWRMVYKSLRANWEARRNKTNSDHNAAMIKKHKAAAKAAIAAASETFYKESGGEPGAMWEAYKDDLIKQPEAIDVMTAAVQQETTLLEESVREYAPSSHRLRKMVAALEKTTDPGARAALQRKMNARVKFLEQRAGKPLSERLGRRAYIEVEHDGINVLKEADDSVYEVSSDEEQAARWEQRRALERLKLARQARDTGDLGSGVGDNDRSTVESLPDYHLSDLSDAGDFRVPLDLDSADEFSLESASDTDPFLVEGQDSHVKMMQMLAGDSDVEFLREVQALPALSRQQSEMIEGQLEASFGPEGMSGETMPHMYDSDEVVMLPSLHRQVQTRELVEGVIEGTFGPGGLTDDEMPGLEFEREGAEAGPQAATGPITSDPIPVESTTDVLQGQVQALPGTLGTTKVVTDQIRAQAEAFLKTGRMPSDEYLRSVIQSVPKGVSMRDHLQRNLNQPQRTVSRQRAPAESLDVVTDQPAESLGLTDQPERKRRRTGSVPALQKQVQSGKRERSRSRGFVDAQQQSLAREKAQNAKLTRQQKMLIKHAEARSKLIDQQLADAAAAAEARKGDTEKKSAAQIMKDLQAKKAAMAKAKADLVKQMQAAQARAKQLAQKEKSMMLAKEIIAKMPASTRKAVKKAVKRRRGGDSKARVKGASKRTLAQKQTTMKQYIEDVIANCPAGKHKGEYLRDNLDLTKWLTPMQAQQTKNKYVAKYNKVTGNTSQTAPINHAMQQAMIKLKSKRLARRQLGALGRRARRGKEMLKGRPADLLKKLKKDNLVSDKKLVAGLKKNRDTIDQRVDNNTKMLKGVNPDSLPSATRNAMPGYELPNVPGISATSDIKGLQQRFIIYMKEAAGKKHRAHPNCKKFEHKLAELLEEEHDIGRAIPELTDGNELDVSRMNQIIDKHAIKVARLAEVFNSFPDNQHQHMMIRDVSGKDAGAAKIVKGAAAMIFFKNRYYMGTVTAAHEANNYSVDLKGVNGVYSFHRKDISLVDDMEYAHLPQTGEFVVHNFQLQKILAKNDQGMAFLTGGIQAPMKDVYEVYYDDKPLKSLTAESGVRRYLDQIAARQTKNGYWNPRAEPTTGDVVKYMGKDEVIMDPLKKATWNKVDVAGAYESGKNVFTKNSKGEIHLRDLRDIERIKKASEMPFVHNTAAAKAGVLVTGVARSSKRQATREQIALAAATQAPLPTVITDAQENAHAMRVYAQFANAQINGLKAGKIKGNMADVETYTELRQLAVNRLKKLEGMITAFNEQQMKVRLNERNASQSLNHHVQRDKLGQMGKGIKDVTSATLAASRREQLQKAANSMEAQLLNKVAQTLTGMLTGEEQQRFQKAWDAHPDKRLKLMSYTEKIIARPKNKLLRSTLMKIVDKINVGVTHPEDTAGLQADLRRVNLKGRKRKMDRLHAARRGVKKFMESHAGSPTRRRKPPTRHVFPEKLKTNARAAAAEFQRINSQQKVLAAMASSQSHPDSKRNNPILHRPDNSVLQKNLPMPDGTKKPTALEKSQVTANLAKTIQGLNTGAQDSLIGSAAQTFGRLNVPRKRRRSGALKRRQSSSALDFTAALSNTNLGRRHSVGAALRGRVGARVQTRGRVTPMTSRPASAATLRQNSFSTGQSASGVTVPVQKQAPQQVQPQNTSKPKRMVQGSFSRTYGIDRDRVELFKERDRRLQLLEQKAREVGIQNISVEEARQAEMGVDEYDSDLEKYHEVRRKFHKKDIALHRQAHTGVPSILHAKELEKKIEAIGAIPHQNAFYKMAEAIRMARHHNIPQFVHNNGDMIPLRLDPKLAGKYKTTEINAFVNTFLKQVQSHWVYTTMGQVGVDGDHSKATHQSLVNHKLFREDAHKAQQTQNIGQTKPVLDELMQIQAKQDMSRRRYRDLSTVARERGRELAPEEIAGRTGISNLPLTQEEIRDNIPRMIGGGGPSKGYDFLKGNKSPLFKIATAAHTGAEIEDELIGQLQGIDEEIAIGAKGDTLTLTPSQIDEIKDYYDVDLGNPLVAQQYLALLSDPIVRKRCEVAVAKEWNFAKIRNFKLGKAQPKPAAKHPPKKTRRNSDTRYYKQQTTKYGKVVADILFELKRIGIQHGDTSAAMARYKLANRRIMNKSGKLLIKVKAGNMTDQQRIAELVKLAQDTDALLAPPAGSGKASAKASRSGSAAPQSPAKIPKQGAPLRNYLGVNNFEKLDSYKNSKGYPFGVVREKQGSKKVWKAITYTPILKDGHGLDLGRPGSGGKVYIKTNGKLTYPSMEAARKVAHKAFRDNFTEVDIAAANKKLQRAKIIKKLKSHGLDENHPATQHVLKTYDDHGNNSHFAATNQKTKRKVKAWIKAKKPIQDFPAQVVTSNANRTGKKSMHTAHRKSQGVPALDTGSSGSPILVHNMTDVEAGIKVEPLEALEEKASEVDTAADVLATHQDGVPDVDTVFGTVPAASVTPIVDIKTETAQPSLVTPVVQEVATVTDTTINPVLTSDEVKPADIALLPGSVLATDVIQKGGRLKRKRSRSLSIGSVASGEVESAQMEIAGSPQLQNISPSLNPMLGVSPSPMKLEPSLSGKQRARALPIAGLGGGEVLPGVRGRVLPGLKQMPLTMLDPIKQEGQGGLGQGGLGLGQGGLGSLLSGGPQAGPLSLGPLSLGPQADPLSLPQGQDPLSKKSPPEATPMLGAGGQARPVVGAGGQARPLSGVGGQAVPSVIPGVNNDARQRRIQNPGVPLSSSGKYDAMPVNWIELQHQRQLDEEGKASVLFKYVHEVDAITDYNIEHTIFVRVGTTMVEMIVFDKAREWHLHVAGYFLAHCVGELLVNNPTQSDTSALRHIFNITNDSKSKDVGQALKKNIDERNFPIHFVLNAKFNVKYSSLAHKTASRHTIRRIVDAMRQ